MGLYDVEIELILDKMIYSPSIFFAFSQAQTPVEEKGRMQEILPSISSLTASKIVLRNRCFW